MSISPSESKGTTVNLIFSSNSQNPNFPNHGDGDTELHHQLSLSGSPSRSTAGSSGVCSEDNDDSSGKVTEEEKLNSESKLKVQNTGNLIAENGAVQIPKGTGSARSRGKSEVTSSHFPQNSSPGKSNPPSTNARGKRLQIANANHLLNFQYDPIARPQPRAPPPRRTLQKIKPYNKDLFLQANFKFVVLDTGNYTPDMTDPDKMLQWEDVICVKHSTPFPVNCPICLEQPLCPQITSCGHIFCFPCILQYLLMGKEDEQGESWKRCPLCLVMISPRDLYTIYIENVKQYIVGDTIDFMLLTREKNSLSIFAKNKPVTGGAKLNDDEAQDFYSKFSFTSDVDLSVRQAISDLDSWLVRAESGLADDIEKLPYVCASVAQLEQRKKYWESHQGLGRRKPSKESLSQAVPQVSRRNLTSSDLASDKGHPQHTDTHTSKQSMMSTFQPEEAVPSDMCDSVVSSSCNGDKKLLEKSDDNAYTFYQAVDGQLLILHPLNMRCLLNHYGNCTMLPNRISGRILQLETVTQTEAIRRRYRYLSHFSLTTTFQLCEIDLSKIIPPESLSPFMDEIRKRENQRKRLAKKEEKDKVKAEAEAAVTEYYPHVPYSFTSSSYNEPPFSLDDFEALGSSSATSSSPPQVGVKMLFSSVTKLGYAACSESPVSAQQSTEATCSRNTGAVSFANIISRDKSTEVLASPKVNDKGKKGKKASRVLLSTAGGRRY